MRYFAAALLVASAFRQTPAPLSGWVVMPVSEYATLTVNFRNRVRSRHNPPVVLSGGIVVGHVDRCVGVCEKLRGSGACRR